MQNRTDPKSTQNKVVVSPKILASLVALSCSLPVAVEAANWTIEPSISVRESYTDNIDLDNRDEESAFVTEISPQISVKGEGARLNLDFNYRLQNILRSAGDQGNSTNHQLQADALAELIENLFFLDVNGSMGQTNGSSTSSSTERRSGDNISGTGNRGDFWTAGFSPYITPHLGGYLDGEVRYRFNTVRSDDGFASDSEIHEQSVRLNSGSRFKHLTWYFNHSDSEEKRSASNNNNADFRNTNGEVRFRLTREFSAFVQAGNYQSEFVGADGPESQNVNGSYTTVGAAWTPSRKFSLEGGVGQKNSFVTLSLTPSTRTSWVTTFRDSDVGTNTGKTWNTAFSLKTRRTTWGAKYFEDTSTYQQVLLEQGFLVGFDPAGQLVVIPVDIPTAVDEVFTRQRGELSFTGKSAKSTINLKAYSEKRHYQASDNDEDVLGWNASWNWQMTARTNSILSFRWQKTDGNQVTGDASLLGPVTDETYRSVSLRLNRRFTPNADGNIELLRAEQSSDDPTNDYDENRITAGITVRF